MVLIFQYFIFEDRYYLITKIYLSPKIIYNTIKYIQYGLKRAYKISLIRLINPKLVVTYIHNSENFSFFAKFFNNEINFLAIQNGNSYHKIKENNYRKISRNYYIPHLLKLGYFEDDSFKNSDWNIKKSDYVGSLRFDSFLNQSRIKNEKLKKKYDLCILSDFGAWEINEEVINTFDDQDIIVSLTKDCVVPDSHLGLFKAGSVLNVKILKSLLETFSINEECEIIRVSKNE